MTKLFFQYCYKKPTPTDILNIDQLDFLSRALFREILAMCRNEPDTDVFWHGNKRFSVKLNRGQMILRIKNISGELGISPDAVKNRLNIINEIYTDLEFQGKPFGTIVTLKDYDALIKMVESPHSKTTSKHQQDITGSSSNNNNVNTRNNVNIYKKNYNKETEALQKLADRFN